MTNEDKELLLKDLCARLPYGLIVRGIFINYNKEKDKILYEECDKELNIQSLTNYESLKQYLRPMSSMTREEKDELKEYLDAEVVDCNGFGYSEGGTLEDYTSSIPYSLCSYIVDWLNKHHFDFRGLIEKGLALEAPEDMYH